MANLEEELLNTLEKLEEGDFNKFKWFLKHDDILEGFKGIPVARLEKAERQDTVDLMVQQYQEHGALKVTWKVLKKIHRNDLIQCLQQSISQPKDLKKRDFSFAEGLLALLKDLKDDSDSDFSDQREYEIKKAELKSVQQFAVQVTLDPDTAHPALILSEDGKQVHHGDVRQKLPDNPERFDTCVNVLGKQRFSSGRFYYEVQVKGKTKWTLGVVKESIDRKGKIRLAPEEGFWTIWLRKGYKYEGIDDPSVLLSLKSRPEKVGVFVNYDEGLVRFYDVDTADVLYSFTDCSFTEKLLPYFSPYTNKDGTNSAPLIISPVNHLLNVKTHDFSDQKEYEIKKAELKSVQQFAVQVTLDPDTAHPKLILSEDGKQVHCGDVRQKLPDNPERFDTCVNVLGKQRFSSGRFYYEVQVKGKTKWTLGVVKESIDRKGKIRLAPEEGFWTIWLRKGYKYEGIDDPSVLLSLKSRPEKVGVFVNYDEGLVRFYDVDTADRLYSFTDCSFTEKLLPYFSPYTNKDGTNSAPLIIYPVIHDK